MNEFPNYCCQKCGECIGYIGLFLQRWGIVLHACQKRVRQNENRKHYEKMFREFPVQPLNAFKLNGQWFYVNTIRPDIGCAVLKTCSEWQLEKSDPKPEDTPPVPIAEEAEAPDNA